MLTVDDILNDSNSFISISNSFHPIISFIIEKPSQTVRNIQNLMAKLRISDSPSNRDATDHAGNRVMGVRRTSFISNQTNYRITRMPTNTENKLDTKTIKKLYMNNKVGRMKNTQLETIFEHEEGENENRVEVTFPNNLVIFSKQKVKRVTTFHDINSKPTKTLKEKRKKRIRKVFGKQKRFKRISMESFLKHLNIEELVDVPKTEEISSI